MAEILKCFCRGCPEPQPRPRARIAGKGRKAFVHFYDQEKYPKDDPRAGQKMPWVIWRETVARTVMSSCRPQAVEGPIRLTLDFFYPRPQYLLTAKSPAGRIWHTGKDDGDNLQKLIQDVLTECKVWRDDNQVCSWGGEKWWVAKGAQPGCWIIVETLEDAGPVLFQFEPVTTSGPIQAVPMREVPVKPVRLGPRLDDPAPAVLLDFDGQPIRRV